MESNKTIISYCKSKADAKIGADYFKLLTWATYYSGKVETVDRLYICLYNNIDIFSKLKEKTAVYGLIQFLQYFISNQFAFFKEEVLVNFLKSLDKIPKKDDYYITFMIENFLPMILVISQDYGNIIVSSDIFYHSVKYSFSNDKLADILTTLTSAVMNETTIPILCNIYFSSSVFDIYLKQNNSKFFKNIYDMFNFPAAVDAFVNGQSPEVTMIYLQDLVVNTIYMKQLLPLEILHMATVKFIANHKSEKRILSNPLTPIIEMWVTKGELLKVLFQELLDSSVPLDVAKKVAKIICIVFGGLSRFTIPGLNLIHASDCDLYSPMEPSIRLTICVLRIDLINRYSQTRQDGQNFFKKDLKKLVEYELFDTNIIQLYMTEIIKLEKFRTSPELANLVSQIFCQTMDLSIFKSNVIFIFEFCKLTDDQQDFSVRHCLDLALSPVVEDSEIKDANCQTVYTRLSIFMSFVDFMYSSYNRTPKITKRPPYKDIKCNDPRVRKILDYASSIQYF